MENKYNQLPAEVKVLIVNAKTLVDDTRKKIKLYPEPIDLTCRLQLRDDCGAIERCINKLGKRSATQKDVENLELAMVRLETSAEGILKLG